MKNKIDLQKTLNKCEAHWKASKMNSSFKYTVFEPVYIGKEYNGEIDDINTQNTEWNSDEIITFNNSGWDNIESEIIWSECSTKELYKNLKLNKEKLKKIDVYLDDILNDSGIIRLSEKQKKIIEEWKNDEIEELLSFQWTERSDNSYSDKAKTAIYEYGKRNKLQVI